jgi:hypothetical protein
MILLVYSSVFNIYPLFFAICPIPKAWKVASFTIIKDDSYNHSTV